MANRRYSFDTLPKAAVATLVAALATAAALVALPREIGFSASQGQWLSVSRGLRISEAAPVLRAGEYAWLHFAPVREKPTSLFLLLSRRRDDKPVVVEVLRGRQRLAELRAAGEPQRLEIPVETRLDEVEVRLDARSLRPRIPAAFLLHRFGLVRPWSLERLLAWAAPAVVGIGLLLLLWTRTTPGVAALGGLHGAVAVVALLLLSWDPLASQRLAPETWRALALAGLASLSALVLIPRLRRGASRDSPHGRVSNGLLLRAASLWLALGCAVVGLILEYPHLLRLGFPALDLADADVLVRAETGRNAMLAAGWITLVGGLLLGTSTFAERLPRRFVAVVLFGIQLVFYLGALEALVAPRHAPLYFPPDPVSVVKERRGLYLKHAHYGHVLNPDAKDYEIGVDGFRGPPFPYTKPPGEQRVVMIGDSIAFGLGVPEDSTCGAFLQRELESRLVGPVRVINAGVPAHDSLLALRRLEGLVLQLSPDVVTATVGWNDLSFSLAPDWKPGISLKLWGRPPPRLALMTLAQALFPPPPARTTPHPAALEAYTRNLRQMLELGRRHGFRVVFTNLPTIFSTAGNTPEELRKARVKLAPRLEQLLPVQATLDRVCDSEPDAVCVRDVFPLSQRDKGRFFYDYCHPVPEGYALMAERIARVLLDPEHPLLPLSAHSPKAATP